MGKDLIPNTRLNHYRIRETLGSGGMGTVYRAEVRAARPFAERGSTVALKVLHPHLAFEEELVRRFHREAEIGKRVRHRNLVSTFAAETALVDGLPRHFLVMEFVEGETLREVLSDLGWFPEGLGRHVGIEVSRALAALHEVGAIHRDVKPENVLIDKNDTVKLMDLGVAKLPAATTHLTTTGQFVGSFRYAAPEQFRADSRMLDARTDLYGLGLLLYELATGSLPFAGDDLPGVMHEVMHRLPRRLGEVNPQFSPVYEALVHRLMEKRPEDRFGSTGEVLDVLERGVESDWWRNRSGKTPRRHVRVLRETAFFGRRDALATISRRAGEAAEGQGATVFISGEPGIGKSRLLAEALDAAGTSPDVLSGSFAAGTGDAVAAALRSRFGEGDLAAVLAPRLPETPDLVPAFAAWIAGRPGGDLPPETLATLVVRTFAALASEAPLLLVLEDLHEAPGIGRRIFESLVRACGTLRILILATSREPAGAELRRRDRFDALPLPRLTREEVRGLLTDVFGSGTVAEELLEHAQASSGGNPFFLMEVIRVLEDAPFLARRDDGRYTLTGRVSAVRLPDTVTDLLRARIDSLDDGDRELLDLAACLGTSFDPDVVIRALSRPRVPALRALAAIEREHGLVRAAGRRFEFDHDQVRGVLESALPPLLREEYHARIGAALGEDADPAEVVRHRLAGGMVEDARPHLEPALDRLRKRHEHESAAHLAALALEVPGFLAGVDRRRILERRADHLSSIGRREEEQAALREALELAAGESAAVRARIRHHLGRSLIEVSLYDEAERELLLAVDRAREAGNLHVEGGARASLGHVALHRADYDAARDHFERHRECAAADGDCQGEGAALGNLGLLAHDLGRLEEAAELQERSAGLARSVDDLHGEACALSNGGLASHLLGRLERAREQFRRALDLWRRIGNRQGEGVTIGNLGLVESEMGRIGDALGHYERQLYLARETGYREGESIARYNLGSLRIGMGDLERSRADFEKGRALAGEIGSTTLSAMHVAGTGDALWLLGDETAADEAFRDAAGELRDAPAPPLLLKVLVGYGRFLVATGRRDEAGAVLAEAAGVAREIDSPESRLLASALQGAGNGAVALFDELRDRLSVPAAMEVAWHLFLATGEDRFRRDAAERLDLLVAGTPESHREAMIDRVPLHREIRAAM
jgi:serine/threonine-protein kinase